ncbi:hypothetical protein E4P42_08995 [Mycobacterium sp. PS03-16]|uniref:hypothetical protein n=1 Tax=Mycobacterium sp. PS03-16 TaxID=2559611 RepID=UPI00107463B8|nr:hypothetical protein [Mycobacterium sp. PS03-16]TFV59090.1 hypothetical protein E4P42_08995 [Mycobacterium sp. PS03-16]
MTDAHDEDDHSGAEPDAASWHNSTPKLLAASVAGLAAIGLAVTGVTVLARDADEPPQAPSTFVDTDTTARTQTTSVSEAASPTLTTRINPPQTTDIDLPPSELPPPPHPTESTSGEPPRTTDEDAAEDERDEESTPRTTRNRPRLNETRTLYPRN